MKIGCFGNCQAGAISQILKDHLKNDEIISFKAVHTMTHQDKIEFLEKIKDLDILIHQPISDVYTPISTDKILSSIEKDKSILFPVIYFSTYFMDITYLKNTQGATDRTFLSDYHSRIILSAFVHGLKKNDIQNAFKEKTFFSKESILNDLKTTIDTLREREKNFDNYNLFFTFNHPTGHLLYYVVDQILKKLGKHELSTELKQKYARALGNVHWKTVESIKETLQLKFSETKDFYINNKLYSLDEFIDESYRFYSDNPQLVENNKSRVLPKSLFENF